MKTTNKVLRWTQGQLAELEPAERERVERLLFETAADREEKLTDVIAASGVPCDTPAVIALILIAAHASVGDGMFERAQFVELAGKLWDFVTDERDAL